MVTPPLQLKNSEKMKMDIQSELERLNTENKELRQRAKAAIETFKGGIDSCLKTNQAALRKVAQTGMEQLARKTMMLQEYPQANQVFYALGRSDAIADVAQQIQKILDGAVTPQDEGGGDGDTDR